METTYDILYANRLLRDETEMQTFISALDKLIARPVESKKLENLYRLFSDDAVNTSPLKRLLAYIDQANPERDVSALLAVTPELYSDASLWLRLFYVGKLGDAEFYRQMSVKFPNTTDKAKQVIRDVLEDIKINLLTDDEQDVEITNKIDHLLSLIS